MESEGHPPRIDANVLRERSERILFRHLEQLERDQQSLPFEGKLLKKDDLWVVLMAYKIASDAKELSSTETPLAAYSTEQVRRMREFAVIKRYGGNGRGNGKNGGAESA